MSGHYRSNPGGFKSRGAQCFNIAEPGSLTSRLFSLIYSRRPGIYASLKVDSRRKARHGEPQPHARHGCPMNRYDVLGLKPEATSEEIKKAYKKLAAKTHPDLHGDVMAPLFMSVQDAYETLSVPAKRAAYDRDIGAVSAAQTREPAEPAPSTPGPQSDPQPAAPRQPSEEELAADQLARRKRWVIFWLVAAGLAGIGGYWIFQVIQLWQTAPITGGLKLWSPQGAPAVVYAILWAWSTMVAAVADDIGTAFYTPVCCTMIAGAFAFITATGTPDIWWPALLTGLVLTGAIAGVARMRHE